MLKTLVKCFWVFLIGSFMGCIIEEIWCLIRNKCFQIRSSLIHMPLIPIYGFASLIIVLIADRAGYNLWKVFIVGAVVATIVEYSCSYIQEKIFHTKSWDYSNYKFNLNGRVNLVYSIGFGLFSVLLIKQINNAVLLMDAHTNDILFYIMTLVVFLFFIFDVIVSSFACYRQRMRKEGIESKNIFEKYIDRKYPDSKLDKIYNNSVYIG